MSLVARMNGACAQKNDRLALAHGLGALIDKAADHAAQEELEAIKAWQDRVSPQRKPRAMPEPL